jgi:hypothetical protein
LEFQFEKMLVLAIEFSRNVGRAKALPKNGTEDGPTNSSGSLLRPKPAKQGELEEVE